MQRPSRSSIPRRLWILGGAAAVVGFLAVAVFDTPPDLLLATVLVLVTTYYAVQTQLMVEEMRTARRQQSKPVITVELNWARWPMTEIVVQNVGLGSAFDAELTLRLQRGSDESPADHEISWRLGVMAPGQVQRFAPPVGGDEGQGLTNLETFCKAFELIHLTGTAIDTEGARNRIDDDLDELETRRSQFREANLRIGEPPLESIADSFRALNATLGNMATSRRHF